MPKTYGIVFATSTERMTLLADIMQDSLQKNAIDTWHVWNLCEGNGDREWVDNLASENITVRTANNTKEAYAWYTPNKYAPDDVFLKFDDGIVYVDIEGLKHMTSFHRLNPQHYLVSANVVNNPTCYLVQRDLGVWANLEPMYELMESAHQACELHASFLAGEKVIFESIAEINQGVKVPISLVSFLGRDLESVRTCTQGEGEEFNLSHEYPKIFKRPMALFGPCVASLLGFPSQQDMPVAKLLEAYSNFQPQHTMEPYVAGLNEV